jgi:hypothetical protein
MTAPLVDVDRRVRSRWRRARIFLGIAWFVHGTTLVFVALAVVTGAARPLATALAASVLVVGPLVALARWERTAPSSGRPAVWLRRSVGVAVPHQFGFGLTATALSEWSAPAVWQCLAFAAVPSGVEVAAVALAARVLRRPLSAELGTMPVEVLGRIRTADARLPAFLSNDDVVLTPTALVTTVRPGSRWKYVETIALDDITEVEVRRAALGEPWLVIEGERGYVTPEGDLVQVVHRGGVRSLPVEDPAGFAAVLRARIGMLREHSPPLD